MAWRQMISAVSLLALAAPALAQPEAQKAREARFDAAISPAEQTDWLRTLAAGPNHVGSPHDKANAELMLRLFHEWGWDAKIETYQVLYPTPIATTIELIAPTAIKLGAQEGPVPGDDSLVDLAHALPPYVAYQGDGDVTGDLVYVNYGLPEDYAALARRGVEVKGKIAIARYGGGWRGLKPKLAQEHGAIGCLIYSDPEQDGYGDDDVYPQGGARPSQGVQRGSVADMTIAPGDPLTIGIGATANARRTTRAAAPTILKIPTLPISYGDATQLLSRMGGPLVPRAARGGLPFAYHYGGTGAVRVHLAVKSDWSLKPLYNVVATIAGAESPDEWVIRGNHHDGWVYGAADPLSGQVAMLAEAKAIGQLLKAGWKPKRTIVYASWDGEEPGLLGSTEWAEDHAAELQRKALVYINSDNIERGFFHAAGSHEYQRLINEAAGDVADPQAGVSVLDRRRALTRVDAFQRNGTPGAEALAAAERKGDYAIGALGSGSDYSTFLQHLGIASIDVGFGGEGASGGVYHSAYDSFHHYVTFDDPGLAYAATLAKVTGRLVMRAADAATPTRRFADFATTVSTYLDEVKRLADDRRAADRKLQALLGDRAFQSAGDPRRAVAPPIEEDYTPHIELAALENAVDRLRASATAFDTVFARADATLAPATRTKLNASLRDIDQLLLDDRGLPGRPWYRNLIYAPGRFTGYGAKTLPGVREAIEERRFADADTYAQRTAKVLQAYADRLDAARKLIGG